MTTDRDDREVSDFLDRGLAARMALPDGDWLDWGLEQNALARDFVHARHRLLRVLADPPRLMPNRAYRGLGRAYCGYFLATIRPPLAQVPLPFGWRWVRDFDRDVQTALPLWAWAAVTLWRNRWAPMRWLIALDRALDRSAPALPRFPYDGPLLQYNEDGGYFKDIRPRGWRHLPRFTDGAA